MVEITVSIPEGATSVTVKWCPLCATVIESRVEHNTSEDHVQRATAAEQEARDERRAQREVDPESYYEAMKDVSPEWTVRKHDYTAVRIEKTT